MNKAYWYNKGFQYSRFATVAAWGACNSWQRKAFKQGYLAGRVHLEAEALIEGFDDVNQYQKHLIMQSCMS